MGYYTNFTLKAPPEFLHLWRGIHKEDAKGHVDALKKMGIEVNLDIKTRIKLLDRVELYTSSSGVSVFSANGYEFEFHAGSFSLHDAKFYDHPRCL